MRCAGRSSCVRTGGKPSDSVCGAGCGGAEWCGGEALQPAWRLHLRGPRAHVYQPSAVGRKGRRRRALCGAVPSDGPAERCGHRVGVKPNTCSGGECAIRLTEFLTYSCPPLSSVARKAYGKFSECSLVYAYKLLSIRVSVFITTHSHPQNAIALTRTSFPVLRQRTYGVIHRPASPCHCRASDMS